MTTDAPCWDDLRMLLAVHRDGSFLAAGKALGVAPSTVARRVEALERALGHPLVHRGNDGARLDPLALRLVALGEELEMGLASLRRDADEASVAGTVRVSLSEGFVRPITQTLARLRVKHPSLFVEVASESRNANIARGEADIGVRIAPTASPAVVSKRMGRSALGLFASRDYVDRRLPGAALRRAAAPLQDWVTFEGALDHLPHARWLRGYGATRLVFRSNSYAAIEHAVASGMGVGLLNRAQGAAHPALVLLDVESEPPPVEIHLAFLRAARKTPRVRVVLREIEAEIQRHLA
ncbi:MAG: LysR family transcriptional regulator [Polyangiales bacterium]